MALWHMIPNGRGIRKLEMSTIVWAFEYGVADGEMMRHWLDKTGAIVDGLGNWVGEAASMVIVGCIHPLVGNEWWSWVHGMDGGHEFGNLLGAPWVVLIVRSIDGAYLGSSYWFSEVLSHGALSRRDDQ